MLISQPDRLRQLTLALGFGTIVAGIGPAIAPRWFAEFFGIALPVDGTGETVVRSVGTRDAINGIGIISATIHGGRVAPWLLGRLLADATDTLWVAIAMARGVRSERFRLLGLIALFAAVVDLTLYLAHRAERSV